MVESPAEFFEVEIDKQVSSSGKSKKRRHEPTCSELRLAADILESIDDYVSAFDRNWNISYINKTTSKWFGAEPKELIGKNFWKTFPNFVGTAVEKNYREAMTKREIRRFEWQTIYAKTGTREFTVFPSAGGITVYGVDITERKQLQMKLQEYTRDLEKMVEERTRQLQDKERLATIGQTAGMVGHDIRNPLQSMISSIYLIRGDLANLAESAEKKDAIEELESIEQQIKYVDKIVSDLQDYARPLKLELVEARVDELIVSSLSTLDVPENIQAYAYFEGNLPKIRTDPMILKRILLNLATNGIQAMPKGGKLTIHSGLDKDANSLVVTVKDTGVGIPKGMYDKIFTPLFTTKAKGQGFGLAVVKRLIEVLNGKLSFKSKEGVGTEFKITLPLNPEKF